MLKAPDTPGRECSTREAEAPHPGASCQHRFAGSGKPHYCTYIQVQGVIATLHPASTPDEQLVISYLAACVLWWHLQQRELAVIERVLTAEASLTLEQELLAVKRLDRCLVLVQTMQEASRLLTRYIITAAPSISVGFRIAGHLPSIRLARDLAAVTTRLQARLRPVRAASPALRNRMLEYAALADQVRLAVLRLLGILNDPALPSVPLDALLPETLLSCANRTLTRHHPQTLDDPDATDPLVFIMAHQLFEVWFPATTSALVTTTRWLLHNPPAVLDALGLVHRAADLVHLWHSMIHLPQTMSAPDYIAFRAQLEGGSGAESEQFRQVEVLAGLRTATYRQNLESMQLLTPRLEALWAAPSLNEAISHLLLSRGILTLDASPQQQAQQIAAILLPTDAPHPQADVAALCQAALMLDEQIWLWRHHHLAMVRSMIGGKPSIGVGEIVNHTLLTADPQAQAVGGVPYLEQTTSYQLFPLLHQALDCFQENCHAVAPTTRRP